MLLQKTVLSVVVASAILFSGCATTQLKTNIKSTKTIFLTPVAKEKKVVWLEAKNTSASKMDLEPKLESALIAKGVTIVDDPQKANYTLQVNSLFADNLKEAIKLKESLAIGTAVGVGSVAWGNNGRDAILIGVATAIAAGTIGKMLEDETYRGVLDVRIVEKVGQEEREHTTRVLTEAVKMGLSLDEAIPVLEQKTATQIAEIF